MEREILCWKCGKGEMLFFGPLYNGGEEMIDSERAQMFAERAKEWGAIDDEWDDTARTGNLARSYLALAAQLDTLKSQLEQMTAFRDSARHDVCELQQMLLTAQDQLAEARAALHPTHRERIPSAAHRALGHARAPSK
jgi:hypothetical protein